MRSDRSVKASMALVVGLLFGSLALSPGSQADADVQAHDDWTLRCQARENALPCDLIQQIIDKPSGKQVLAISIAWSPKEDKYALQIVVPLGISLQAGLAIRVGEDFAAEGLRVSRCEPTGCFVETLMGEELLNAMKDGSQGAVMLMDATGQQAALPFSLKGFTAAHKALRKETQARMVE